MQLIILDCGQARLDLKYAYIQLVRHPDNTCASIIAAFNRVVRTLSVFPSGVFKLVVTNFFDDFCQIDIDVSSTEPKKRLIQTAELVLDLLGWQKSF